MNPEQALQHIIRNRNFQPGKKYHLEKIKEFEGKNGGTLRNYKKLPTRTIQLKRDPAMETGLYDLKDKDDFISFFEKNYGTLPNGVYTARTSKGGNDGMATLFELRLENGEVVEDSWRKKSQANNKYEGYSANYHAFPLYFKKREELGV